MGNRVFPMFDQPDLKAKMNLSIGCPSDWEAVLSNEDEDCKNRNFVASPSVCTLTKNVLKDFQNSLPSNYIGYPYPFNKYDQVFAHEYKWGAMENAGIVTLNDLYIFKDPVSTEKMISFGNTIVH